MPSSTPCVLFTCGPSEELFTCKNQLEVYAGHLAPLDQPDPCILLHAKWGIPPLHGEYNVRINSMDIIRTLTDYTKNSHGFSHYRNEIQNQGGYQHRNLH